MERKLNGDHRLMGALALITYGQDNRSVLIIKDQPKTEVSTLLAPLTWWPMQDEGALGLPGGGRAENSFELQETLFQSLSREIQEEINLQRKVRLPKKNSGKVFQQFYPSVAGQVASDGQSINQIAVTSVLLPFEKFGRDTRYEIESLVGEEQAYWMSIETLARLAKVFNVQEHTIHDLHFRPQVLTAAYVWHLSLFAHRSASQIEEEIIHGNRQTIAYIAEEAKKTETGKVTNGTLRPDGRLMENLHTRDLHFIQGKRK